MFGAFFLITLAQQTGVYFMVIIKLGSMNGPNIKQAKDTLLLFLKSLPVGCYFNIISFGSSYSVLFPE